MSAFSIMSSSLASFVCCYGIYQTHTLAHMPAMHKNSLVLSRVLLHLSSGNLLLPSFFATRVWRSRKQCHSNYCTQFSYRHGHANFLPVLLEIEYMLRVATRLWYQMYTGMANSRWRQRLLFVVAFFVYWIFALQTCKIHGVFVNVWMNGCGGSEKYMFVLNTIFIASPAEILLILIYCFENFVYGSKSTLRRSCDNGKTAHKEAI